MIDYGEFFKNTKKPIVWTLHDTNPFTGGCHYSLGCIRYKIGCGKCPNLGSNKLNDLSRKIFKRKQKAYKNANINVVTPSRWLASFVKESLLLKDFSISVVPYSVPSDIFKPQDKIFSRRLLNLPEDKTIILFGVDYLAEYKGFNYLLEALEKLKEMIDISKIVLVTLGVKQKVNNFSFPIIQLGRINDEILLSCVYSSADILVMPSIQEAFGNICLEALSCGIPVIGFDVGGIADMIIPEETGLLAKLKDSLDLAKKIVWMTQHPKERQEMGINARRLVEQEYTLEIQAKRYLELYKFILK